MSKDDWYETMTVPGSAFCVGDDFFDGMGPTYLADDVLGVNTTYATWMDARSSRRDSKLAVGKEVFLALDSDADETLFRFYRLLHFGRRHITVMRLDWDIRPLRIPLRCVSAIERVTCRIEPIDWPDTPKVATRFYASNDERNTRVREGAVRRFRASISSFADWFEGCVGDDVKMVEAFIQCLRETGHKVPACLLKAIEMPPETPFSASERGNAKSSISSGKADGSGPVRTAMASAD